MINEERFGRDDNYSKSLFELMLSSTSVLSPTNF